MKKILIFFLLVVASGTLQAQESPVKLASKIKHICGNKYELIICAEMEPEWAMYSQNLPKGGPFPTKICFEKGNFKLVGKLKEISKFKKVVNDEVFNLKLTKYYNNVVFKQTVILNNKNLKNIKADINYMTCTSDACLPPTQKTVNFGF